MKKQSSHNSRSTRSTSKKQTHSNTRSISPTKKGLDSAVKSNMNNNSMSDDSNFSSRS